MRTRPVFWRRRAVFAAAACPYQHPGTLKDIIAGNNMALGQTGCIPASRCTARTGYGGSTQSRLPSRQPVVHRQWQLERPQVPKAGIQCDLAY
jgi:hypothetical protein